MLCRPVCLAYTVEAMKELKDQRKAYWPQRIRSLRIGPELLKLLRSPERGTARGSSDGSIPVPTPPEPIDITGRDDWISF
jgi:hypothetical protein